MQLMLILILVITLGIFITLYVFSKNQIKRITSQLSRINNTSTNSKILVSSSKMDIVDLVLEINKTLEEKQKSEIKHKKIDLELRQAIANMSHDLRTPLTSIIGYIQLIEEENISNEDRKEYTDIVKRRAESLQDLISSFYDLSRLESKEYKFELKAIQLNKIIYDQLALFYRDFVSKNIEPVIDADDAIPSIIADENAVKRIFSNIIQNALKYGNEYMEISLKQNENYIITTFTNGTTSLKEEDIGRIFERFFTADLTRTNKSTGLGLAITKELVEQMGHIISARLVDSKLSIVIKWKLPTVLNISTNIL